MPLQLTHISKKGPQPINSPKITLHFTIIIYEKCQIYEPADMYK